MTVAGVGRLLLLRCWSCWVLQVIVLSGMRDNMGQPECGTNGSDNVCSNGVVFDSVFKSNNLIWTTHLMWHMNRDQKSPQHHHSLNCTLQALNNMHIIIAIHNLNLTRTKNSGVSCHTNLSVLLASCPLGPRSAPSAETPCADCTCSRERAHAGTPTQRRCYVRRKSHLI